MLAATQETESGASPAVSNDTPASSVLHETGSSVESIDSLPTNSTVEEKS